MPTSTTLTLRQINRATLARQMLLGREPVQPIAAIERLLALQAQWPRPPFVALWTRLKGFERAQLTSLFLERRIVRATFFRATIHVLSAADFVALRPAVQPALDESMQAILKERLEGVDLDALIARARRILEERPRTFEEVRDVFRREQPEADARAMAYAVRMRLPLVQVPSEESPWAFPARAGFTPADRWLRQRTRGPQRPDAGGLLERYLSAYGPAAVRDFQAWTGLSPVAAREMVERARPRLRVFRDERKRELLDLPDAPRPAADAPAPVRLLPEYDSVIATRADERLVAKAHRPRVFLPALRIAATVLVDGFVAATWEFEVRKKVPTVTVAPFGLLPRRTRTEIEAEAEAFCRFAEPDAAACAVRFGP